MINDFSENYIILLRNIVSNQVFFKVCLHIIIYNKMFKRITHIIFATIILVGTIGMTVSLHYCGNSINSINVITHAENCCGDSSDCCHNETFTLKKVDLFAISLNDFDFKVLELDTPIVQTFPTNEEIKLSFSTNYKESVPPPNIKTILSQLQTYLL